jgi:SRSO17 transposase
MEHSKSYEEHFYANGAEHARHYLSGLLGTQRRKNMERLVEDAGQSDYQGMQQFLSGSPWSHEAVMEQVGREAEALLGRGRDTALYVDESSFVKKGGGSVGVRRQYCGRLGKLENCQVGVYASLGNGMRAALVDYRLFLPEEWAKDPKRCEKAGVPPAKREHRTKPELALAMIRAARQRGSTHRWVGVDEGYGNNEQFLLALERQGEIFMADIARNHRVHTADPARRPAGAKQEPPIKVEALAARHFEKQARLLAIRDTAKGTLEARVWVSAVWLRGLDKALLLVVREDAEGTLKYSLTNAPAQTSWERLAYMQGQRYWIERAFQDAKSELGMAQYQLRGWNGWHHHMALVCLAMLFVLKERLYNAASQPLLSARDIVELLCFYLPRRERSESEIFRQMQARHAARQRDIDNRRRRQRLKKISINQKH